MNKLIYIGNYLSGHQLTPNFNIYLAAKLKTLGFETIQSSSRKNRLLRLLDMWFTLFRERSGTTHVLIDVFSTQAFWFAWSCSLICRLLNLPYICIVRGGAMANRMQRDPRATGMLLGHAKVNLAPSQHHFELLTRHGFETLYVPNFLELNLYTYKLRKKATPNLLWVRSLHRIYQPLMAVRLLERLLQDYPQATLTMVGPDKDGSMAIIQKYITEHQLTDQVRLTGLCTKSEWHALAASHDIFLNTTSIDNHPVSVIEAMALGLPVVSTNAGGLKQLLTHEVNALLSDPDQENDMLKHIYTILQNPDWCERLSNAGRALVEDFDWEKIKRHYQEILGADNQFN